MIAVCSAVAKVRDQGKKLSPSALDFMTEPVETGHYDALREM
jgi:hypothetical protein